MLHLLLNVFIHCGTFHGQGARHCGALLARVRVCLAAAVYVYGATIYGATRRLHRLLLDLLVLPLRGAV